MSTETAFPRGATALVTGAGSGIGRSVAEVLIGAGCRVVCAGRRLERLRDLAEKLGDDVMALELDVDDPRSVATIKERLPAPWREIDILVNNAGHDAGGRRRFDEGSADEWAAIIRTNVTGLIRVTRELIPGMVERDRGHVINIGSIAGLTPYATGSIYSASKHAVHGFSESLRLDFAGTGIRVTEILPGLVRTDFAVNRWKDETRARNFYDDFGVCLAPEDVARTILFALQQPAHVVISQLVVVPSTQT